MTKPPTTHKSGRAAKARAQELIEDLARARIQADGGEWTTTHPRRRKQAREAAEEFLGAAIPTLAAQGWTHNPNTPAPQRHLTTPTLVEAIAQQSYGKPATCDWGAVDPLTQTLIKSIVRDWLTIGMPIILAHGYTPPPYKPHQPQ